MPIRRLLLSVYVAGTAACAMASAISVGKDRQLFIDNFVVESAENLKRVLHRPTPHPANPLLTGDKPWERWNIGVNGRCVIYDEEAREFRMWYGAYSDDPSVAAGQGYRVCYATSKDGVHWNKPSLGQALSNGSRDNNIFGGGENWMRRPNVIKDEHETDLDRRYKMTYVDVLDGKSAIIKAYSRDGLIWRLNGDGRPWFRGKHNSNLLGWDPRIQRYVLYPRMDGAPISVGRSTSEDFITWSEPELILSPEPAEKNTAKAFKGNAAFIYEGIYLGLLWVFQRETKGADQKADAELVFSRDGTTWQRLFPNEYFLPRGSEGSWDCEGVLPVPPAIVGDTIYIHYSGWNYPYSGASLRPVQEGWIRNGQRVQGAVGLATLKLDRFVSFDAGRKPGRLTTKALAASGSLEINASVKGELRVEILDEEGRPLPGFAAQDCSPIRADGLRHKVRWSGGSRVEGAEERPIKLRFILREGSLFSFSFSEA